MATNTADTSVIDLESHPRWRSARRYSRERSEAMRRHPSYCGHLDETPDQHSRTLRVVTAVRST